MTQSVQAHVAEDPRLGELRSWLETGLGLRLERLEPASSDASFRRYFRAGTAEHSYIVMDAPPEHEDLRPFLHVAALLASVGVAVPAIHARDERRGYLLLSDFGCTLYLDALRSDTADALYGEALDVLVRMSTGIDPAGAGLPPYDEGRLRAEMDLFRQWFAASLLGLPDSLSRQKMLDAVWERLVASALQQPQVFVHRDYHSRNLMLRPGAAPGVLDFQDAVIGPVTYDLVSLLRDCYIVWPAERVRGWALGHAARLTAEGVLPAVDEARFLRWFDWMGLQRHIKVLGIFARLWLRDGKPRYLNDLPRVLDYVLGVGRAYPEFSGFVAFLEDECAPRLPAAIETLACGR